MTDRYAQTRSLLALDIEHWSSRNAIEQRHLQQDLTRLVDEALEAARIDPSEASRQATGDGLLLSFPADVPKRRLTQLFVHSLDESLREHVYRAHSPERRMRLRLALHSGDIVDDGAAWQGRAVVEVCRLLDAEVLRRVLREATTSMLAVLVSAHWYDEVIGAGWASEHGYRHVVVPGKDGVRQRWVRVPGLSSPPGLTDADQPQASPRTPRAGRSEARSRGNVYVNFGQHAEGGSRIVAAPTTVGTVHGNVGDVGARGTGATGGGA